MGLNCMLDKKRKMYKKYIFKNVWHVLLFLLFGQPSIVVVRPALLTEGGH